MYVYIYTRICIYIYLNVNINRNTSINICIYVSTYIWSQLLTSANDVMYTRRHSNPKPSCIAGKQMSSHVCDLRGPFCVEEFGRIHGIPGFGCRLFCFKPLGTHAQICWWSLEIHLIRVWGWDNTWCKLISYTVMKHSLPAKHCKPLPSDLYLLVVQPHNVDVIKSHSYDSAMIFHMEVRHINEWGFNPKSRRPPGQAPMKWIRNGPGPCVKESWLMS